VDFSESGLVYAFRTGESPFDSPLPGADSRCILGAKKSTGPEIH
jgi:hypothetical protein